MTTTTTLVQQCDSCRFAISIQVLFSLVQKRKVMSKPSRTIDRLRRPHEDEELIETSHSHEGKALPQLHNLSQQHESGTSQESPVKGNIELE